MCVWLLCRDHVVVLFAVGVEGSSIAEFGLGELVCVCEVFSITVCVVLFDANCDTAPPAPVSLIRLNHKTSHQVLYIYTYGTCTYTHSGFYACPLYVTLCVLVNVSYII